MFKGQANALWLLKYLSTLTFYHFDYEFIGLVVIVF